MQLAGAVVLITGGSSGIGAATARAMAEAGARPLVAGRDREHLDAVAAQTGGVALIAELAAPAGAGDLADAAVRAAPDGIDVLVNNAGIGWEGPFGELPATVEERLVAVNLTAPLRLTRLLAPAMAHRGRGHVVFVSSIAGATGVRREAAYAATKAGVHYFAESIRYELRGSGAGVSVVFPGAIDTPFFDRRGAPYQRRRPALIAPERVARAILTAVETNRPEVFVPGWLRYPASIRGAAPGLFRSLASRFG
jgi:short-subunit dehydrogenase